MTELMRELYYMIDDWAGQHELEDEEAKALLARQSDIKNEIECKLGEDGRNLLDELSNLSVKLEDIHNEALFRAAVQLGTQIAHPQGFPPQGEALKPVHSTSR